MVILGCMAVRPIDLGEESARVELRCGECVAEYSVSAEDYDWMFPGDLIVCEACGGELVLPETTAA